MSIERDPLFGGMTRPSLLWGIPPAAFGFILVVPLGLVVVSRNLLFAAAVPALYLIIRAICAKDPRQMGYIRLAIMTKYRGGNRRLWKASSYSPIRFRKRKS